ncbi:unnamed protein product [Peniophora sp. CBMAI 1063]|nr:unnamed protein product [Peniophora sp. CBMAI 1063]
MIRLHVLPKRGSCLSRAQTEAINTILEEEFTLIILDTDPTFSGFRAVSRWASWRKDLIFAEDPLFRTPNVVDSEMFFKQAVNRRFRNFYHKLKLRRLGPDMSRSEDADNLQVIHPQTGRELRSQSFDLSQIHFSHPKPASAVVSPPDDNDVPSHPCVDAALDLSVKFAGLAVQELDSEWVIVESEPDY